MATIETVLGPIDSAELGFTLMHEHLLLAAAGVLRDYPELLGGRLLERIVATLTAAKTGGVDTIVDASTFEKGREVSLMAEASRRSGVTIVAATGWHNELPRFFRGVSVNQLAELFSREIVEGISGTGIKAAVLKAGSDREGVTAQEESILRAVARAHRNTGAPIILHSYAPGEIGRRQLEVLTEEGVDPGRVKVDHCNNTTNVDYLLWLLDQGCYLGMDHYPTYRGPDPLHQGRRVGPLQRTETLKALLDRGHARRVCPSHDWIAARIIAGDGPSEEQRRQLNPLEFLYVSQVVIPQLREMGVEERTLESLCVEAPRRFFEGG